MEITPDDLPDDIDALKAALRAARAEVAVAEAQRSADQALIAHLKLTIAKLNREKYGSRSERTARLLDQLELQLEDLETAATEDELAAEKSARRTVVSAFTRKRPSRQPFPADLPRERVVVSGPQSWITSSVVPSNPQGGGDKVLEFSGNVIRCHEFTAWQTRHERNLKIVRLTNK